MILGRDDSWQFIPRELFEMRLPLISGEEEWQSIPASSLYKIVFLSIAGRENIWQFIPRQLSEMTLSFIDGEADPHDTPIS